MRLLSVGILGRLHIGVVEDRSRAEGGLKNTWIRAFVGAVQGVLRAQIVVYPPQVGVVVSGVVDALLVVVPGNHAARGQRIVVQKLLGKGANFAGRDRIVREWRDRAGLLVISGWVVDGKVVRLKIALPFRRRGNV